MATKFGEEVESAVTSYKGADFTVYDISVSMGGYESMSINFCNKTRYHLKRLGYKCKQHGDYYSYSLAEKREES